MAHYDYKCDSCGTFEIEQKISEPHLTACPTCQGPVLRLISKTSFKLEGSGWARDNYGSPPVKIDPKA